MGESVPVDITGDNVLGTTDRDGALVRNTEGESDGASDSIGATGAAVEFPRAAGQKSSPGIPRSVCSTSETAVRILNNSQKDKRYIECRCKISVDRAKDSKILTKMAHPICCPTVKSGKIPQSLL